MTVISIPEGQHKRKMAGDILFFTTFGFDWLCCLACRPKTARTTWIFAAYFLADSWSKRWAETFNQFFCTWRWRRQSTLNHDGHQHSWKGTQKENGGRSFIFVLTWLSNPKQLDRLGFLPLIFRPLAGVSGEQRPLTIFFSPSGGGGSQVAVDIESWRSSAFLKENTKGKWREIFCGLNEKPCQSYPPKT